MRAHAHTHTHTHTHTNTHTHTHTPTHTHTHTHTHTQTQTHISNRQFVSLYSTQTLTPLTESQMDGKWTGKTSVSNIHVIKYDFSQNF